MHSDDPSSARPSPAATLVKIEREEAAWVERAMRRKEMEWGRAENDIRLQLDRRHAQLSDTIKDTEDWMTLELTTKERRYVKHMLTVLSLWRRVANEILSGSPLSNAARDWREYPELFLYSYRKALEARGSAVGEHLGHLADELSSKFAEANETAVETWVARKAGLQPRARNQKQADVRVRMGNRVSTATASKKEKRKPKPKALTRRERVNEFLRDVLRGESNRKQFYSVPGVDPSDARRWQRDEHVSKRVSDSMESTLKMTRDEFIRKQTDKKR